MVKALIAGRPMHEMLDCKGRLRASCDELFEALSTEQFSAVRRFVAEEIMQHIEQVEQRERPAVPPCAPKFDMSHPNSPLPSGKKSMSDTDLATESPADRRTPVVARLLEDVGL